MLKIPVDCVKMYPDVEIPKYQTVGSAGCDVKAYLGSSENTMIVGEGCTKIIPTGLKFAIPDGWEMQIRPRSGMSAKTKLRIANSPGTLDCDYIGELKIIIDNIGDSPIVINHGDRIAQLVINEIAQMEFNQKNELKETERGEGGFGSTGK